MKTKIYSLIVIFILGIITIGFTNKANSTSNVIIESLDKNVSSYSLLQSAKIISARLKCFSSEKFNVTVVPEKSQIKVSLFNNWDINTVEQLLIHKGELLFYESFSHDKLLEILSGNNQLFSLLHVGSSDTLDAKIGCVVLSKLDSINDYLKTSGVNQKCKFIWSQLSNNSKVCLYVVNLSKEKGSQLGWSDIESIKSIQDKKSMNFDIEIKFKKSAIDTWANITKRNINKAILITLDNSVLYDPILKSEIKNGVCSITGNFTESEAKFFVALGSNGILPIDFKVVK